MSRPKRKFEEKVFVATASISPTSVHLYSRPLNGYNLSNRHKLNQVWLSNNDHNGKISYKANKRIERALSWLLYMAKSKRVYDAELQKSFTFKINFITLTLPVAQQHTDQEIKNRCLNNFLAVCRKSVGLTNYMWRAEAQSNGNIHFHLVTDKYIHYLDVRKWWNQSLQLLGYIDKFEAKHKHRDPNSTDVHSVKHVRKLVSYLSKYFAKNRAFSVIGELRLIDGVATEVLYGTDKYRAEKADKKEGKVIGHVLGGLNRPIEGRQWYCSKSLSCMRSLVIDETYYEWCSLQEVVKSTGFRCYTGEHVFSYYGDVSREFYEHSRSLNQLFNEHIQGLTQSAN